MHIYTAMLKKYFMLLDLIVLISDYNLWQEEY